MSELAEMLLDAGLVQFGWFEEGIPLRLALHLLPSYPDILQQAAAQAARQIDLQRFDRLLCIADSMPLALALSLHTGIPLVYSQNSPEAPVYDLVGAYDVGHPALIVATSHAGGSITESLIQKVRRVGLEVEAVLLLLDDSAGTTHDVEHFSLLGLSSLVRRAVERGKIPAGQGNVVLEWFAAK
jgi:orotate phosphoribosyltransferase